MPMLTKRKVPSRWTASETGNSLKRDVGRLKTCFLLELQLAQGPASPNSGVDQATLPLLPNQEVIN
jgi:hypothetical protein